jgi:hypothetical protein
MEATRARSAWEATGAHGASAQNFFPLGARLASIRSAALAPFVDQAETHAQARAHPHISVAPQRALAQQVKA